MKELYKPIIRNFEKRKLHSSFLGNIWAADLADMQEIIKFNKGFLLYVVDIYSKYAWLVTLKDKKVITVTIALQKILDESGCKPN